MKTVEFDMGGQTYHLLLNAEALFAAYDRFGDKGDLLDQIAGTSQESFDNTVWLLVKLAQQGELYRRIMGEEKTPMLTVERAQVLMAPLEAIAAREAIRKAHSLGFERQHRKEEEEIDLGLLELQKKTASDSPGQSGSSWARSFWDSVFRKP